MVWLLQRKFEALVLTSQGYSDLEKGFDDISNTHQESVSIVPALSVTTIATTIAYASPIVAYIPNSNCSNEVPIVAARFVTDCACIWCDE